MDVEAEAVTEAVAERPVEVAAVDDVARGGVHLDARRAGADRGEACLLRGENDRVRLCEFAVELSGRERPRVVGDVAADVRAGVDDDELARLYHLVACSRVRVRAGRAGADDRLE